MPTTADLRRIEELGLNSSAPPGQLLYDGWLLRLLPGQAKRARSVNPVYASTRPLPEKIAYCEQLYREHRLPMIFRITPFSEPSGLDPELARLGYPKFEVTAVEAAKLVPEQLARGTTELTPLPEWVEAVGQLRGSPPHYRSSHLERLQNSPLKQRALVLRDGAAIVATGLTIVEDGWAGLFDIVTHPDARAKGHGRHIVSSLLQGAWELGARRAYLQVGTDNTAARNLYRQFGFDEHYQYWYRGHSESTP